MKHALAALAALATVSIGLAAPASAEVPTLGVAHPKGLPDATGLGTVRPTVFSLASTASSTTRDVLWDSWGGAQATGHGVTANGASDPNHPLNVVARNLGTCNGHLVYRQLQRIAPGERGVVDDLC